MSDWWEVSQGECYRHKFTHVLVRVIKVRPHEGFTGLVTWETLNGGKIDGVTSELQEAQHFLEEFDLIHVASPAAAYRNGPQSRVDAAGCESASENTPEVPIQMSSFSV